MPAEYNVKDNRPILFSELQDFFNNCNRSNHCPVCPHTGTWNFQVVSDTIKDGDAHMLFVDMPTFVPGRVEPNSFIRTISVECPNCGHMEFLQAAKVLQYLNSAANPGTKE